MDLSTFSVARAIVHDVPLPSTQVVAPLLSDVESTTDDDLRRYFERRIVGTLAEGFPVASEPQTASPVPLELAGYFNGADFAEMSRAVATHLFNCQTPSTSPGLLTVLSGQVDGRDCLALLKLEKQTGVRVQRQGAPGRKTFGIEQVKELMLTDETRVFKVGLFPSCRAPADLEGLVCDNQGGYRPVVQIAAFFLGKFLGCRLVERADVITQRFFETSQQHFNTAIADAEVRARYEIALLAELSNENTRVRPRAFAETYLRLRDQDPYIAALKIRSTAHQFPKDVSLIAPHIKRMSLWFKSGVRITGTTEGFEESVTISVEGDETVALVRGNIDKIRGG